MKRRSFLGYSCLFLGSCSATQVGSTLPSETENATMPDVIRLAITDAEGIEELESDYETFRQALEIALRTSIEFVPVNSYVAAVPMMLNGDIDLAWAGPSEYLLLEARAKVLPVVSLERPTFKALVAVRADSGITSLADLKGKRIDMYQVGVTSSHLGGVKILLEAGLDPQSDYEIVMSGSHSLAGLNAGDVDAVSRATHRYSTVIADEKLSENDYIVLATSPRLPSDIFVASNLGSSGISMLSHCMNG